jgi:hypothetical protein
MYEHITCDGDRTITESRERQAMRQDTKTFAKIAQFHRSFAQSEKLFFKMDYLARKSECRLRHFAIPLVALLVAISACNPSFARKDEPLPVFDGVTTEFPLTRSRIRKDQPLEVRVTIRNTTDTVKIFRCLDVDVNARIYSKRESGVRANY